MGNPDDPELSDYFGLTAVGSSQMFVSHGLVVMFLTQV